MKTSPAGIALIAHFEGCKLTAYPDASPQQRPTVGVGHTGAGVMLGQRITQARADELLADDLAQFEDEVARTVHVPLTQGQHDAVVSFAFNCTGWRDSTLIRLLNLGDYESASRQFPLWIHTGHGGAEERTLRGLIARRSAEKAMFDGIELSA